MSLTASEVATWSIETTRDPVVGFAANELRAHLASLGAGPRTAAGRIILEAGQGEQDGFTLSVHERELRLSGDNARGLLNAAYWVLEGLGFGWVEPGERGACFAAGASLAEGTYRETPSFPVRTLILGQDALHDDWPVWLEWASRNRFNDLFFHDTPPSVLGRPTPRPAAAEALAADGRGWLFERWDADRPAIVAAARERGMTLQFGGHHLAALMPRSHFETNPEWFPLRGGHRDRRHNLCMSSPRAMDCLRDAAEGFHARFAGAGVYHFWADDIRGGGWCECPGCERLSPADQALRATNQVAAALPRVRVAHLVYHDTLEPPRATEPRENVVLLWAPRNRCFAHAITGASCAKNRDENWAPFQGLRELSRESAAPLHLFEYYSDAILFKGLAPPHLSVLPADARAYAAAGAVNLQDLVVGDRPWMGPPWHAWWAARCAWDAASSAAAALERFCALAFPGASTAMAAYYGAIERASLLFLDLHDLARVPRHDVLDFSDSPRATLALKATEALQAAGRLAAAEAMLTGLVCDTPAANARLDSERIQARFVTASAGHLASRTAAWDAALAGRRDAASSLLRAAERHLAAILDWDARWNEPGYAVVTRGMRRAIRFHTDSVAALF
ncbi:MAG: DUF4838 domain-containing protein [Tepidiformaceae bacterium]